MTNRLGSFVADVSSRVQTSPTPPARSALSEMNTRPVPVAAHSVPVLLGARSIAATAPPRPVGAVRRAGQVAVVFAPRRSPMLDEVTAVRVVAADVVNSGQFASRNAWSPPQSCVRHTWNEPWKIEPAAAGFGSAMIGG